MRKTPSVFRCGVDNLSKLKDYESSALTVELQALRFNGASLVSHSGSGATTAMRDVLWLRSSGLSFVDEVEGCLACSVELSEAA